MNYTTEEQQLIEDAAKKYQINNHNLPNFQFVIKEAIEEAFIECSKSSAMQQIIESRVKAAKTELLEELRLNMFDLSDELFIDQKLTDLTK
jgi:hypothetical protein